MNALSVSKPMRNADGSYGVKVGFQVSGHPIVVNLRTRGDIAQKLKGLVGTKVSFGAQNPYADLWKYTDAPMQAVRAVAQDPRLAQAVQSLPYSASSVSAMNQALVTHHHVKRGRRDILHRIVMAARAGMPAARQLISKLQTVIGAEQIKNAAAKKAPWALQRFRQISQGLSAGDPQAIEAFMAMDGLHRMSKGQPLAQPAPIQVTYDWTGTEQPAALAARIAQAVHFGATGNRSQAVARLRMHLAHVNAKEASVKIANRAYWGKDRPLWHIGGDHPPQTFAGPKGQRVFAGSCASGACAR